MGWKKKKKKKIYSEGGGELLEGFFKQEVKELFLNRSEQL